MFLLEHSVAIGAFTAGCARTDNEGVAGAMIESESNPWEEINMTRFKEQYDRDGYVIAENMFSIEEVAAFKQEIRDTLAKVEEREGSGKHFTHGVYVGLALQSEMFRKLAADSRIAAVLREVIGDQVLFLSDKVVAKDASKDFASPWHQDWPYWKGSNKVSVWIALDDAFPENGCLKMVPGSHRSAVDHVNPDDASEGFVSRLRPEDIDESKVVAIPAKAGTAVIFHDLTFHASYPNVTGKDRWALISTYKDAREPDPEYGWANPIQVVG
ncbi:hypothetical protein DQG23_21915 [Paenibacillus contaminans]|uniref:Phytanoyl-CoA dioxygenase family protein n=2 Tax=Paenibacillus contaminans TaxID=450362 RepID=A0A329MMR6_9BACL|nr:hypothetical protein DQG23_21915 [Paenibacillus contaminans]